MAQEMNGWLVFEWGQSLKVAMTTSPWESEVMVVLLLPSLEGKEGVYMSAMLPADPSVSVEQIQKLFGLNLRRAEHLHGAFIEALKSFYIDEDGESMPEKVDTMPFLPRIIPILPRSS